MASVTPSVLNTLKSELAAVPALGSVLDTAAETLCAAGLPNARRQAAWLWAGVARTTVGQTWLERPRSVSPAALERYRAAVARRAAGEPLAYVIGTVGFRTLELWVDARVLIPRPETEGLVDLVLAWASRTAGAASWGAVADVGTGSGCIGLSLAVEGRFARVVATDLSRAALEVANENLHRVAPPVPVELRHGPFFEPLVGERFAVIISNPPYVSASEFAALAPSVRCFEPRLALVSGAAGMEHVRRMLREAPAYLGDGGMLALEVDATRARSALEMAHRHGWGDSRLERDMFGRERYLVVIKE
jgi:release factor glutamine methyltransferase